MNDIVIFDKGDGVFLTYSKANVKAYLGKKPTFSNKAGFNFGLSASVDWGSIHGDFIIDHYKANNKPKKRPMNAKELCKLQQSGALFKSEAHFDIGRMIAGFKFISDNVYIGGVTCDASRVKYYTLDFGDTWSKCEVEE